MCLKTLCREPDETEASRSHDADWARRRGLFEAAQRARRAARSELAKTERTRLRIPIRVGARCSEAIVRRSKWAFQTDPRPRAGWLL